jgi:hypothetical protein
MLLISATSTPMLVGLPRLRKLIVIKNKKRMLRGRRRGKVRGHMT